MKEGFPARLKPRPFKSAYGLTPPVLAQGLAASDKLLPQDRLACAAFRSECRTTKVSSFLEVKIHDNESRMARQVASCNEEVEDGYCSSSANAQPGAGFRR
jgi:hypothetical protein